MKRLTRVAWLVSGVALALGCSDDLDAGGDGIDAGVDDDPLVFDEPAPAGSLEELQRDIIQERCSGEPGLCHNGQFEPNLSTASNTYAWMVRRPSIENFGKLRVEPNNPSGSFLVDKLRNINGVGTQMPLGAEPLTEEEIGRFEAWINAGALRAPDADPAELLNNPPRTPELAVFAGGSRIDGLGTFTVPQGQAITFRHSVSDFETADEDMFLGGLIITTNIGNVALAPGMGNGDLASTIFDSNNPPMGTSDVLNYAFDFTFGATVDVVGPAGITNVSTAGLVMSAIALYIDLEPGSGGIIAVRLPDATFTVQ